MRVGTFLSWPQTTGSVSAQPASGWHDSVQAVWQHWRIVVATAAGYGAQRPALHAQEDRPAVAGADQHPGQSDVAPGPEPTAEPGSQAAGAATPVGATGRHDHVDIKQLARFNRVGRRITSDPRK
jgi:hypothetical protein